MTARWTNGCIVCVVSAAVGAGAALVATSDPAPEPLMMPVPHWDECFHGPGVEVTCICACWFDADYDWDVDLEDYQNIQCQNDAWLEQYVR